MNDILFAILKGILSISIIVIMRYLLPYLKIKLTATIDDEILDKVIEAVKSVEQDKHFELGYEKKKEVIIRISTWAEKHGIEITEEQLSELIETAVWIMKYEDTLNV